MKKTVFGAFCLLLGFSTQAQYDPKALEILDAMSKKYKSIPAFDASISYTLTNDVEKISEEFKGKITVKGNKYRLALPEQEVINNGTTVWTYLPDAKEVNIDNFDANSDEEVNPSKIFDVYKKGFKYLYLQDKTENGVLCEEVDLVPEKKDAKFFKIKMMISKKDKSLLSFTLFDKSGNRYKYTISNFNPTLKVDDSYFTFDAKKYPGVEIVDLR
jgi:outer membrane lipoprotein-sorting protein